MAIKTINDTNLTAIADAIRAKGVEGNWKPAEMAGAIASIPAGGGDSEYVESDVIITPAQESFYLEVTSQTYVYTQVFTGTFIFNEPITTTTYLYAQSRQGGSSGSSAKAQKIICYDTNDNILYQTTIEQATNQLGYMGASCRIELPTGTKKVVYNHEDYVDDTIFSIDRLCFSHNYYDYSDAGGSIWTNIMENWMPNMEKITEDFTYNFTYSNTEKPSTVTRKDVTYISPSVEVNTQGYLKTLVDGTEYTIYEAIGGSY